MSDYECPSCGGGFPASVGITADECPWCGKSMNGDGDSDDSDGLLTNPEPLPNRPPPGVLDDREKLGLRHMQRDERPVTPHWDSGVRVDSHSWTQRHGGDRK